MRGDRFQHTAEMALTGETKRREGGEGAVLGERHANVAGGMGNGQTEQFQQLLRACLEDVPFLRIQEIRPAPLGDTGPDLLMIVNSPDGPRVLLAQVKSSGQPRLAREAANEILRSQRAFPGAYGVFMAPYVSPRSAALCQ